MMPASVQWYYPKRVIFGKLSGTVDTNTVTDLNAKIWQHIDDGSPIMYLIVDNSGTRTSTVGINDVRKVFKTAPLDVVGWTVIVGMDALSRFTASVVMQVLGARFRFFATVDEGVTFLKSIDDSLADMPLLTPEALNATP